MGYFQDTRICDEHGFVLSPEGTCVRCLKDQGRATRRGRAAKIATGVTVVVASLLGFSAARARVRSTEPQAPVALAAVAAPAPVMPTRVVAPPEAPQASGDWEQAMARAETERQRVAAAQAAAEKQREVAALAMPTPEPESTETRDEPAATVDPAFARAYRAQTRYRRGAPGVVPVGGVNGAMNSPSAWGLPVNSGGNFGNHRGSH